MKFYLLIFLIFFFGCEKEVNKPASQTSTTIDIPQTEDKTKSISGNKKDSNVKADQDNHPGYVQYGIAKVPSDMKYNGSVVAMARWKDDLGHNIIFITETQEKSNEDSRSKELFGYHYITDDSGNKLLWKTNDFINDCPVDLTLDYIDKSLTITDLDKNGIGESSFLYKMSCKGDVSSNNMKLIMHEGESKYAIRGVMNLVMNKQELEKGSMTIDSSFDKAPVYFLEYAKGQWNKYKTENIGN